MDLMDFTDSYLEHARAIIDRIDRGSIERAAQLLREVRDRGGRLFLIGSGGGAGHASHATCDFRKIGGFEAYCPSDNVSELSARINDDGWETCLSRYLEGSRIGPADALLVFSVGGGSIEAAISMNLVHAVQAARRAGAAVLGIVGRDGGYTAQAADACIIVPAVEAGLVTALTESFQALIWHLLVSHPLLQTAPMKWESL
jgi:D-sedoheptulose 7-phosphate isomerase